MDLSDEQISILKERAEAGAQLNDLQKIIQNEFEKSITYMDTRFLISDLGIVIKQEVAEEAPEEGPPSEEEVTDDESVGNVRVEVDQVQRPGMIANGSVTWSDGVTSVWFLDQMGQLGLDSEDESYQPSPEDVQEFQLQLKKTLRP